MCCTGIIICMGAGAPFMGGGTGTVAGRGLGMSISVQQVHGLAEKSRKRLELFKSLSSFVYGEHM